MQSSTLGLAQYHTLWGKPPVSTRDACFCISQRSPDVMLSGTITTPQVLQTSSPSYILLASLDAARRHTFTPGVWRQPLAAADAARDQLAQLPRLSLLQDGSCGCQESVLGFDPCRLVLNVSGLGVSGFAAAAWLEEQHSIVPELATNKVRPWRAAQQVLTDLDCWT